MLEISFSTVQDVLNVYYTSLYNFSPILHAFSSKIFLGILEESTAECIETV